MVSVTMATSEWIQFFKEAGIPPGPAVNYAVMFVDNRIQKNMLMDLNKEIMNELGITIVGDIIAILKHAKVVYRQEMCKAATESVASNQTNLQSELRRNANSAATRMIANSLSRDSPPSTPVRRPDSNASKISVTVSNKMAAKNAKAAAALCSPGTENSTVPVKRRRVTAEMEGKYIVHMPKGTTPRTKKILEQQAAKGLQRTSVFDRLGAETSADTTTGNKPTGVFSRLGDMQETEEDKAAESDDDDDDSSVLPYAGVLKKFFKPPKPKGNSKAGVTVKAKATSSEPKVAVSASPSPAIQRLGSKGPASPVAPVKEKKPELPPPSHVAKRLGKRSLPTEAQDSSVTSSKSKPDSGFRVTIKRTLGSTKVFTPS
ncbi:uncharacterized protein C19orf47 homolog isoform X2 [Sceloporus undulatus]|uniref:uncharacterized protein C19orf47 homolog isoform X2 n=1 Tax=Sceloporus undulatus TaxID=8520 RepID=UPI001C4CC9BB|nr:uncharacterized protein C19orf47 homolog isoform X2 [Sceloporus undulatus]